MTPFIVEKEKTFKITVRLSKKCLCATDLFSFFFAETALSKDQWGIAAVRRMTTMFMLKIISLFSVNQFSAPTQTF